MQHLVAGIAQRLEGEVERFLGAGRGDDLARAEFDATDLGGALGDRLTQGRLAADGGVVGRVRRRGRDSRRP